MIMYVYIAETEDLFPSADHLQSAPELGQRMNDVERGMRTSIVNQPGIQNPQPCSPTTGYQTEMRTFRAEVQERQGRNYRRPSPSPPRRPPPRDHADVHRTRQERPREPEEEEEEEEPPRRRKLPRERELPTIYRPVYRGTKYESYRC